MSSRQDIRLSLLISKLIHRIIMIDRDEKACQGVTLSQHYTMDVLFRKQELTMKELSLELNLAISTLTRIVDILVRDGLIERKPSLEDRRKVLVTLTEKGLTKAKHLRECTQLFWTNILDTVPKDKKADLMEHIKILLDAMGQNEKNCYRQQKKLVAAGKKL